MCSSFAFGQETPTAAGKSKNLKAASQSNTSSLPRLIVVLTIDQMRADLLERFEPAIKKTSSNGVEGLLNLRDQGVWFANAWTAGAPTVTAAGHASICTGANPSRHGIVGNEIFDPKKGVRVGASEDEQTKEVKASGHAHSDPLSRVENAGSSRARMKTPNLADVLHEASGGTSRSLSVAIKDRGSVFCAGRKSSGVYWFDYKSGGMISSTAFTQVLPEWVNSFNTKLHANFTLVWNPLLPLDEMKSTLSSENARKAFSVRTPFSQWFGDGFPYEPAKGDSTGLLARQRFQYTPEAVRKSFEFALEGVRRERLGCASRSEQSPCTAPAYPDLLTISISTTDLVGHAFGPDSPELMDIYLNLNRSVQSFTQELEKTLGKNEVLYVVSSDHGVQSMPEVRSLLREGGGRAASKEMKAALEKIIQKSWGEGPWIAEIVTGELHFNKDTLQQKRKTAEAAVELIRADAQSIAGVRGLLSRKEILQGGTGEVDLFKRGHDPERSGAAVLLFAPGWIQDSRNSANHGSAYADDARIPILFSGWNIRKGVVSKTKAYADDIVPTLLEKLKVKKPAYITGTSHAREVFASKKK